MAARRPKRPKRFILEDGKEFPWPESGPTPCRDPGPNDAERVAHAIRREEGQHLARECKPTWYTLMMPDEDGKKGEKKTFTTCFCGGRVRFAVPYWPPDDEEIQEAAVCLVDDAMHLWPRFRKETNES